MQLGNILTTATNPVVCKPVKFKVLGRDPEGKQVQVQAAAVFALVDEAAESESTRLAYAYLRDQKDQLGTDDDIRHVRDLWFLMAALRDSDDPQVQFCPNADFSKLRLALVKAQVKWLRGQYDLFQSEEYPELLTPEQKAALLEDATGK